jgi:hypothetical protein
LPNEQLYKAAKAKVKEGTLVENTHGKQVYSFVLKKRATRPFLIAHGLTQIYA